MDLCGLEPPELPNSMLGLTVNRTDVGEIPVRMKEIWVRHTHLPQSDIHLPQNPSPPRVHLLLSPRRCYTSTHIHYHGCPSHAYLRAPAIYSTLKRTSSVYPVQPSWNR